MDEKRLSEILKRMRRTDGGYFISEADGKELIAAERLREERGYVREERGYEVANATGIPIDITLHPENVIDGPLFFLLDQDGESITVTLRCLNALVYAATRLIDGENK